MIHFSFDDATATLRCAFEGRLDSPTSLEVAKRMQEKLEGMSSSSFKVVFDMNDVEYVASAFIRICLQTAKEVGTENFSICNTSPYLMKTFKMSGLDAELNVS